MIKVLIADDQADLTANLKDILSTDEEISVVGIAQDGEQAVNFVKTNAVDLVLLDIRMPIMNGVTATKEIKNYDENIKVLILTTFDDSDYILDAMNYGANGYLLKDINASSLISAIKNAMIGDTILPTKVAMKIAAAAKNVSNDRELKLKKAFGFSDREIDVAMMIYENFTNRQITSALNLNEGTTRNYISGIYEKIGVNSRTDAIEKMKDVLN